MSAPSWLVPGGRPAFLLPRCKVEGTVKYVVLRDDEDGGPGEIRFVDPLSAAYHSSAVLDGELAYSAGRVTVCRRTRSVLMDERDSYSLGVASRPGDEDAELVRGCLFDHWPRRAAHAPDAG